MYTPPCLNNLVIEYTPPDLQDWHTHTAGHEITDIHHSRQSTQQATKPAIPKVVIGQNRYPLKSPTQTTQRLNRSSGRPHQQHQPTRNPQLISPPFPKNRPKKQPTVSTETPDAANPNPAPASHPAPPTRDPHPAPPSSDYPTASTPRAQSTPKKSSSTSPDSARCQYDSWAHQTAGNSRLISSPRNSPP